MLHYALVFLGAGLGGVTRYGVNLAVARHIDTRFPLATFLANVTGCFLAGVAITVIAEGEANDQWRLLLVVGVLGGYTTFSTFGYETLQAIRLGHPLIALGNAVGSVPTGLAAVWAGVWLARH